MKTLEFLSEVKVFAVESGKGRVKQECSQDCTEVTVSKYVLNHLHNCSCKAKIEIVF